MTYWLTFNLFQKKRIFRKKKTGKKPKKNGFFFRQLKKTGFFKTLALDFLLVPVSEACYSFLKGGKERVESNAQRYTHPVSCEPRLGST